MEVIHKIGRRKTSVARVYMSEGKGDITVNKKSYSDFFRTTNGSSSSDPPACKSILNRKYTILFYLR